MGEEILAVFRDYIKHKKNEVNYTYYIPDNIGSDEHFINFLNTYCKENEMKILEYDYPISPKDGIVTVKIIDINEPTTLNSKKPGDKNQKKLG
ncbi:MAG: hypothetical protein OEY49_17250 [Candidatus Heimdallarchaeota archaeon]|nr:hypothetical protein [Candidatus Heimdallarchaeota archaeon]